jgi:Phospholipase_D-nuclease N-terminal
MNDSQLPHFLVGLGVVGLILALVTSLFWLWMLIDCATNTRLESAPKIIWLLVIFFFHFIGAVIYFFAGRGGTRTISRG